MLINVTAPIKKDEIKELLQNCQTIKYVFVKFNNPMELQFEVTVPEDQNIDVVAFTKRLIKSTDWGMVMNFRVLEDGKPFSWS